MSLLEECIRVKSFIIRVVLYSEMLSTRPACCVTSTAESGGRNVTKDINHVCNSFISVIHDFVVAQGTTVGTETEESSLLILLSGRTYWSRMKLTNVYRLLPKVTDRHVKPGVQRQMKVNLAAQVNEQQCGSSFQRFGHNR
jgi:hypothetical protein